MKTFTRLFLLSGAGWSFVLSYGLFTVFYVLFSLINFSAIVPALEVLFNEVDPPTISNDDNLGKASIIQWFYGIIHSTIEDDGKKMALIFICAVILVSVLLSNLFRYLSDLRLVDLRISIIYHLRKHLFNKITSLPLSALDKYRKGDLTARLMNDVQEVENSIVYTVKTFLKEPFLIIGYIAILYSISPSLTFYSLLIIPFSGLIISTLSKRLKKKALKVQNEVGQIGFVVDQTLDGVKEIKSYLAQPFIKREFDSANSAYARFNRSMAKRFQLAGPISEFLGVVTMVIILLIGGEMVMSEPSEIKASQFIAFLVIFSQVLPPVKSISQAYSLMQRGMAGAQRVFDIIDDTDYPVQVGTKKEVNDFESDLVFKDVSFEYPQGGLVVNQINLVIERGRSYALIGPSGSGKSTLVDLLQRFYEPSAGEILLDGQNIQSFDLSVWRNQIGVVSQKAVLFNDTIRNNILLGRNDVSDKNLKEAIEASNSGDFIYKKPLGLETIVGDRGSKLSGGEIQRIAIARAIIKNAPILVLDEATSAIDHKSEGLIREALSRLMSGRTTLMITHRLSSILPSDVIIELEGGRIKNQIERSSVSIG